MSKCPHCKKEMPTRTETQNSSLWLFMTMLAKALNDAGLEPRKVLKSTYNFQWTKEMIHDAVWVPIQKALFGTTSTRSLKKLEQIDAIHSLIMRELGEKHGLEYIAFPSNQTVEELTGAPLERPVWRKEDKKVIKN